MVLLSFLPDQKINKIPSSRKYVQIVLVYSCSGADQEAVKVSLCKGQSHAIPVFPQELAVISGRGRVLEGDSEV